MPVVKTTSPAAGMGTPKERPSKTVPSSRTSRPFAVSRGKVAPSLPAARPLPANVRCGGQPAGSGRLRNRGAKNSTRVSRARSAARGFVPRRAGDAEPSARVRLAGLPADVGLDLDGGVGDAEALAQRRADAAEERIGV